MGRYAWIVFVSALALRLVLALAMPSDSVRTPISSDFTVDANAYVELARSTVEHGVYGYGGRPSAFRAPLYPAFLAAVFAVKPDGFGIVRVLHAFLGAFGCLVIFALACRVWDARAGLVAGLAMCVYPFTLYFVGELMTETLFITLAASSCYATLRLLETPTLAWRLAAGAGWGLSALCRPMAVGFIALLGFSALACFFRRDRPRALALLTATLLAIAIITPWVVRNSMLFEAPVFLTTNTGHNLYKGLPGRDNVTAVEELGYNKTFIEDPTLKTLPDNATEAELDKRSREFFLNELRARPAAWLGEKIRDMRRLWFDFNLGGRLAGIKSFALLGAAGFYLAALLLHLLATGILVQRRAWLPLALVWTMILVTAFMYFPFFSGKRFRIPTVDPYLLVSVGILGSMLWKRLEERISKRAGGSPA